MPLSAGTRLGPYEVLSALGAGGMGEVYRARDSRLNRDVALKVLPREFLHDGKTVSTVMLENLSTHEQRPLACDGVFIFAGMTPNLDVLPEAFELDRFGYLQVDEEMRTSVPNVFAAGDIVSKRYRQMTTAISDGTIASIVVARELAA